MQSRHAKIFLQDDLSFLPVIQTFIEKTALAFGSAPAEALALTLAGEEIFTYLCDRVKPEAEIEINCSEGIYYTALTFTLPLRSMTMRAFNLTATINIDDENSLNEMGLMIAARMVDQLQITERDDDHLQLMLRKEKNYPETAAGDIRPGSMPTDNFMAVEPDPEELKYFVNCSRSYVEAHLLPREFNSPGKIVDMVKSGDYQAAILRDPAGHIGGGILWHWYSSKVVECHGPFILADDTTDVTPEVRQQAAEILLEKCLNAIARTPVTALLTRTPAPDLPHYHFETLGTTLRYHDSAPATRIPALFRQLQEDPGTVSWIHPALEDFLRSEYRRLALPREIRLTGDQGETGEDFSVLTTESDRTRQMITLYPLWTGRDMEKNIADHLSLCRSESFINIFFVLDLGRSSNSAFVPALLKNGFTPRLLLPYGGRGDLLILQETETKGVETD